MTNSERSVDELTEEQEANLFALELLVPRQFLKEDLREIGPIDIDDEPEITRLARRYGVSAQMMIICLTSRGYVEI